MLKEALASPDLTIYPVAALLVFAAFTLLLIAWLYRPGAKDQYVRVSERILNDESER